MSHSEKPTLAARAHQGGQVGRAVAQHQELVGVDEGHEVVGRPPPVQAAVVQRDLWAVRARLGQHCAGAQG